jgi:hypothetical protein
MPLPQMKPRKTRSSLGGSASIFLFGTASMACYTTDDKQHRDEDTMVCFYEKNNPCSTKGQGNTIGANRHQWCGIECGSTVSHRITINKQHLNPELRKEKDSFNP